MIAFIVALLLNLSAAQNPIPAGSRCISIEPICPPGKHAICICESDISFTCAWICASG